MWADKEGTQKEANGADAVVENKKGHVMSCKLINLLARIPLPTHAAPALGGDDAQITLSRDESFIKIDVYHNLPISPPRFLSCGSSPPRRGNFGPLSITLTLLCRKWKNIPPPNRQGFHFKNDVQILRNVNIPPPSFGRMCHMHFQFKIQTDKNFIHGNGENCHSVLQLVPLSLCFCHSSAHMTCAWL